MGHMIQVFVMRGKIYMPGLSWKYLTPMETAARQMNVLSLTFQVPGSSKSNMCYSVLLSMDQIARPRFKGVYQDNNEADHTLLVPQSHTNTVREPYERLCLKVCEYGLKTTAFSSASCAHHHTVPLYMIIQCVDAF